MARPGSASRVPQGGYVLTEILVVHSRLPHYMAQDAMAVFAPGRARRLHHDAFGKEDRLVGRNERALSLPGSHTRRISAPSRNSWQGDAILPLCVNRGIGPCGSSCMSR